MGFKTQSRQLCRKCKGTGASNREATDRDGNVMIADPYNVSEQPRPIMENCGECAGTGWSMYETPKSVIVDGAKVELDEQDRRQRFSDTAAA